MSLFADPDFLVARAYIPPPRVVVVAPPVVVAPVVVPVPLTVADSRLVDVVVVVVSVVPQDVSSKAETATSGKRIANFFMFL